MISGPDALVRDILAGLAEGRLVPGQRLVEPDLMARHGVGRSTVREALARLATAGVVEQAPHRGARIRWLTRRGAGDVLRVAQVLLALAARQAAEAVARGADPAVLVEATRAYDLSAQPQDRARYYRALTALAGNAELMRLLPLVQVQLVRAHLRGLPARARAPLVEPIAAGHPDAAEKAAADHVAALIAALPGVSDGLFAPDTLAVACENE
jgi:DNA-binding GntR family transcriptional regulator